MKRGKRSLRAAWELQMDGGLQGEGAFLEKLLVSQENDYMGQISFTLQLRVWALWLKRI